MSSPFDSLKRAVQAVVGAPDLFHAARDAGASASGAADVMAASAAALHYAARDASGGPPGEQNAVRHFVWQAYLAARHGAAVAEAVAAAQEEGRETSHDTRVDLHNNAVGRAYGETHAGEIGTGSVSDAIRALVPVGRTKFAAGELIWVR